MNKIRFDKILDIINAIEKAKLSNAEVVLLAHAISTDVSIAIEPR